VVRVRGRNGVVVVVVVVVVMFDMGGARMEWLNQRKNEAEKPWSVIHPNGAGNKDADHRPTQKSEADAAAETADRC